MVYFYFGVENILTLRRIFFFLPDKGYVSTLVFENLSFESGFMVCFLLSFFWSH